jgi:ketosteroid isomerase-like protein
MTRHALPAVLLLALVGLISACQPAPETNRNAAQPAEASPTKEPVDLAAIEAEVTRLEREWANTMKTHSADVVKRVLADDAVMTYPDGTTGTKADEIRYAETAVFNADSFEITESKVTVLDADAAFITGRSVIKKGTYKPPTGKAIDISGEYRFTDVFARRNGTWQVVASQATKIVAPTPSPSPSPSPKPSAPATAPVPPAKSSPPAATKTP